MKNFLLILSVFFALNALAQKQDSAKVKRISFGISCSPDFCYRNIGSTSEEQWIADERNKTEIPKIGFTAGINFNIKAGKRFYISTGFLFSNKGFKTKKESLSWVTPDPDFPVKSQTRFNYQYLEIPVKLNYFIVNKKIKIYLIAGVSVDIFLKQRVTLIQEYSNGNKSKNIDRESEGYSKYNLMSVVGAGLKYDLTKNINIRVEPLYKHAINPTLSIAPTKDHFYSIGLNVGVYRGF